MNLGHFFQLQSSMILLLMFVGVYFKTQRKKHVPLMASAILWDVVLILQIELDRQAVEKAVKVLENSLLLNIHVCLAISVVILYIFMITFGRKLYLGDESIRKWHSRLGKLTLVARSAVFITSFMIKK